jgi:hypothetical protein
MEGGLPGLLDLLREASQARVSDGLNKPGADQLLLISIKKALKLR